MKLSRRCHRNNKNSDFDPIDFPVRGRLREVGTEVNQYSIYAVQIVILEPTTVIRRAET
jgi:hypothetical protein